MNDIKNEEFTIFRSFVCPAYFCLRLLTYEPLVLIEYKVAKLGQK